MALARVHQVALQVQPRSTCITMTYYMDGTLTGELMLLRDERHHGARHQLCRWRSELTKLTTDWHGHWVEPNDGFEVHFNYRGHLQPLRRAHLVTNGVGFDDLNRQIVVVRKSTHILDMNTMQFILQHSTVAA